MTTMYIFKNMNVRLWITILNPRELLYDEITCFAHDLEIGFNHIKTLPEFSLDVKIIEHELKSPEYKDTHHIQDKLDYIFDNHVTMDIEFAKVLNVYDQVSSQCFKPLSEVGNSMIRMLNQRESYYILKQKSWSSTNNVELELIMCHDEKTEEAVSMLKKL